MHNALFTRFATASIAVAPLALVSALIGVDGSHAGQASDQTVVIGSPEATAPTGTPAKPRPARPRRPADPTLDSLAHSAGGLIFGRASGTAPDLSPLSAAIAPASRQSGQDEITERGRSGDWSAGLATAAYAATPYGRSWIDAPKAAWNAGRTGASNAFTAPAGTPGSPPDSEDPAGGTDIPGNPQVFYATENPVIVLTAASPGATPAESAEEPLASLAAPLIATRDTTNRAIPEPAALGLALGALGLLGIGHRGQRPARRKACRA